MAFSGNIGNCKETDPIPRTTILHRGNEVAVTIGARCMSGQLLLDTFDDDHDVATAKKLAWTHQITAEKQGHSSKNHIFHHLH